MNFIENIKNRAKQEIKTIVLPESEDIRTLKATQIALKEKYANIVLVGNEEIIKQKAQENNINIEGATIINPQKLGGAVSCYFEIETSPSSFTKVIQLLCDCPTVTQIYRTTGKCRLHVHAVAANHDELEGFLSEVIDKLPDIVSISTNVILSSIKDIKGLRL